MTSIRTQLSALVWLTWMHLDGLVVPRLGGLDDLVMHDLSVVGGS